MFAPGKPSKHDCQVATAEQTAMNIVKKTKVEYSEATGKATFLFDMVETDSNWSWARGEDVIGVVRRAEKTLKDLVLASSFAKEVFSKDAAAVKKDYDSAAFVVEASQFAKAFQEPISELLRHCTCLQMQQNVKMAHAVAIPKAKAKGTSKRKSKATTS